MNQPVIVFQELTRIFQRHKAAPLVALDHLNLDIEGGQVFGLLGPNGSGKTTTVNLLCGLLEPSEGRITVAGLDIATHLYAIRARLGVVPQETALDNELTALENLEFHARFYQVPKQEQKPRIAEMLDLVGLAPRQHDRVGTFSGGMQRRLALARALLTQPEVVVLDEPTLGVDVQSRAALWERIRAIAQAGKTVLLTTNYMEEAQALADRIAILDHSRLVTQGTPVQLQKAAGQAFVELTASLSPEQLRQLTLLPGVTAAEQAGEQVRLAITDQGLVMPAILTQLNQMRVVPKTITLRQPDLNDVFLSLTGRALRD